MGSVCYSEFLPTLTLESLKTDILFEKVNQSVTGTLR